MLRFMLRCCSEQCVCGLKNKETYYKILRGKDDIDRDVPVSIKHTQHKRTSIEAVQETLPDKCSQVLLLAKSRGQLELSVFRPTLWNLLSSTRSRIDWIHL